MVFTKSPKRFFDLDAVREPPSAWVQKYGGGQWKGGERKVVADRADKGQRNHEGNPAGTPPLDWWLIDPAESIELPEAKPMTATMYIGDVLDVLGKLPENSVDLVLSSPPFLALRSYLPSDHPDKEKEGGSQSTPGEYIDWLLDVVEASDRVLAPHGSLCFELGDTYSGASGWQSAGPDLWSGGDPDEFSERKDWRARPDKVSGAGWPLPKSLSLIPESFRFAMVYGFNPFTGRQTERWRLRNVIRWVRPNPPVGALGDKFRPATSELMVFCKSAKRYFDLDAVREPYATATIASHGFGPNSVKARQLGATKASATVEARPGSEYRNFPSGKGFLTNSGAPPLDWWNIPLLEGEEPTKYGPKGEPPKPRSGIGKVDSRDAERAKVGLSSGMPGRDNNPLGAPPLGLVEHPPRRL